MTRKPLWCALARRVLVRAGQLVQPIAEDRPAADGRKTQVTILKPLTVPSLAYLITSLRCTYIKFDGRSRRLVPCDPPERILRGLLEQGAVDFSARYRRHQRADAAARWHHS